MADLLELIGGGLGAVGGFMVGGPVGAATGFSVGRGVGDIFGGDNNRQPGKTNYLPQVKTTIPAIQERELSSLESVNRAFREARSITSPAFSKAGQSISSLLGQARSQYQPLLSEQPMTRALSDVLEGRTDITSLPGYRAKEMALRNMLGATGQTQSVSGTAYAFEPLISSTFESLVNQAQQERREQMALRSSIADLFRTEAGAVGGLPIQEAQTLSNLAMKQGLTEADISQSFAGLISGKDISEQQLGINRALSERKIAESEAGAQGKALSNLFGFGMDFLDIFGDGDSDIYAGDLYDISQLA